MENPEEHLAHENESGDTAIDTTRGYVLNWLDPGKGGPERYDFLTIREDHPGSRKPFFAGMGGNLYIGVCDP
jgi:hypothetical protein